MEFVISILSVLGMNGVVLFFVKRFFNRRDRQEKESKAKWESLFAEVKASLETIRLLSYARMSEEIERLLTKGYATSAERRIIDEMYSNYKSHGWNGDMDARLKRVYALPTEIVNHKEE